MTRAYAARLCGSIDCVSQHRKLKIEGWPMKAIHLSRGFLAMTLGLATVVGAARAAKAEPAGPGDVPRSTLAPADYRIVKSMHAMSMVGISAGEIAQKNGGTQAVRDFGTTLVDTHTTGDQQVLAYAKKAGIDPNRMKNEPPPQELAYYLKSGRSAANASRCAIRSSVHRDGA